MKKPSRKTFRPRSATDEQITTLIKAGYKPVIRWVKAPFKEALTTQQALRVLELN